MARALYFGLTASLFCGICLASVAWGTLPMIEPPGLFNVIYNFPAMVSAIASAAFPASGLFLFGLSLVAALAVFQAVALVRFLAFRRQITDTTATSGRYNRILTPVPS